MRSTGILRYGALLIPAAAAVSFAATPHEPDFPIIGGLYGQPARLLVAGDGSLRCSIASEFRTGAGSPPGRTFDLTPGQTAFTDVSVSRLSGRLGDPVELLPFVKVLGGRCSASIEVIEQFTARYTTALTPEIVQDRDAKSIAVDSTQCSGPFCVGQRCVRSLVYRPVEFVRQNIRWHSLHLGWP